MTTLTLSALIQKYFTDRLYNQLEASPHTISSYRDSFRLLLRFAGEKTMKTPTKLTVNDLDVEMIVSFLDDIERHRKNSARSRNTRLAAIRSFFRYVAIHEPAYMYQCQKILNLPGKRYVKRNVEFLNSTEMQALLNAPDCSKWIGCRDHTLLTIALQTGLRASELINLRCCDVVLDTGAHVRCEGKGRKHRATPLRRETVTVIKNWLKRRGSSDLEPLFPTIRGDKMSRDALEHLVKRHVKTASKSCPSLIGKRVSPHVLRHSTAMDLLHHGIDQTVIALWLGHESIETTQIYIHADMKLKEKALARMSKPELSPARYKPDDELLRFLENL
ncbi:Site-specific recombinase XerD [Draconibacterium orientale]|uniref:Integrase n=1 Tax=Draconibacterium orientale TaxID=1168034 RepID=X5DCS4_9BACT|nr:tyrosine-type recombinase/integrase [Draconibacterium orientale]AHW60643.1 integrase [Draconibacterium orientale]SET79314.1 Site-specific recombinase XerD [Draconibacterium orientale]